MGRNTKISWPTVLNWICVCPVFPPILQHVTTPRGPHLTLCCLEIWLDTCLPEQTSWRWGTSVALLSPNMQDNAYCRWPCMSRVCEIIWNFLTGVRQLRRVGSKGHWLCGRWLGHPPRWVLFFFLSLSEAFSLWTTFACEWRRVELLLVSALKLSVVDIYHSRLKERQRRKK